MPDYEVGDLRLLALVQAQEIQQIQAQEIQQIQAQEIQAQHIQALEIRSQQEALQHSLTERWAQYLAGRPDQDLLAGPELKALLRNGVPPQYRARVWRWIVRARTSTFGGHRQQSYQQVGRVTLATPTHKQTHTQLSDQCRPPAVPEDPNSSSPSFQAD